VKTRPKPHTTPEERRAKITNLRDRLEEWQGTVTEEDIAIFVSIFDGYSPRNACLIAMQRPDATDVRGFRKWLSHGRAVRRGETGIAILAPVLARKGNDNDTADDAGESEGHRNWEAALHVALRHHLTKLRLADSEQSGHGFGFDIDEVDAALTVACRPDLPSTALVQDVLTAMGELEPDQQDLVQRDRGLDSGRRP
jgi:N-terminal domain of anti-restriction factor ArdC